ncbi:MAG: sigma-70 family RNA polymerase sigma factor [Ignavibacteria bacterium]|nr:sigma-70 family RNA polymerase sigma factor [Ignavibacteria bacterium]
MLQDTDRITRPPIENLDEEFRKEALPHMDALYNFALQLTQDSDDAADLLQETYIKAYRFWDKFEKGTNCKAWLFRIMKNSFINFYRKNTKSPEKLDYDEIEEIYETIKSNEQNPHNLDREIYDNVFDDEVMQAINSLPEEFKTVLLMCDVEGMSYEEIADFMDIPIGTVRSRIHRARKLLAVKLYDYAKSRGYNVDEIGEE